ncbi:transposase [Helicobacter pylori]|nr:transposase [Helicobacter pylori]
MEKNYLSTSLLDYKQQRNGKLLVKVSPTIHQQNLLSLWEHQPPNLKLNHRQYLCPDCGHKEHRDINAANNIEQRVKSFKEHRDINAANNIEQRVKSF